MNPLVMPATPALNPTDVVVSAIVEAMQGPVPIDDVNKAVKSHLIALVRLFYYGSYHDD